MGVWDQLIFLEGQTLKTLDDQKPFEIMDVSDIDMQILIYANMEERKVKRSRVELAWRTLRS